MMASPSVFNFFQSDFQPAGKMREMGLFAPEFQMLNDFTSIGFHAYMYRGFAGDNPFEDRSLLYAGSNATADFEAGRVVQDFSVEQALYDNNEVDALINRLDLILTQGDMQESTKDTIRDLIFNLKSTGHGTDRLKLGFVIEMVIASPEYNILR